MVGPPVVCSASPLARAALPVFRRSGFGKLVHLGLVASCNRGGTKKHKASNKTLEWTSGMRCHKEPLGQPPLATSLNSNNNETTKNYLVIHHSVFP